MCVCVCVCMIIAKKEMFPIHSLKRNGNQTSCTKVKMTAKKTSAIK